MSRRTNAPRSTIDQSAKPAKIKINEAGPFEPAAAAAVIKAELPTGLAINSNVWSPVFGLVTDSPLFADHHDFWTSWADVDTKIGDRGPRFYNTYEAVRFEMEHRLVQTAYAAGWVASTRQFESVAKEALDLSQDVAGIVSLTRLLGAAMDAMPLLDAVVIRESRPSIANVVELVRTKAESLSVGLLRISGGAR